MELNVKKCPICGGSLKFENGIYKCVYCDSVFQDTLTDYEHDKIMKLFDEYKLEQYSNAKNNLYNATHEKYLSKDKIMLMVNEVKKLNPDDCMALFHEVMLSDNKNDINYFLDSFDYKENEIYLEEIVSYVIRNLDYSNVISLKNLIDRGLKGDSKTKYNTLIEDETLLLNEGIYNLDIDRDVFVCYSSKDIIEVRKIVNYLEKEGLTCFVALRNLRHGLGSVENYEESIYKAMRNSRCFLFVSSENSRAISCDSLKMEIPYLIENLPDLGRIEYVIEDYTESTSKVTQNLLKKAFKGLEWCRTYEDLLSRVTSVIFSINNKTNEITHKYCVECGCENEVDTLYCKKCGKTEFRNSFEEVIEYRKNLKNDEPKKEENPFNTLKKGLGSLFSDVKESVKDSISKVVPKRKTILDGIEVGQIIKYGRFTQQNNKKETPLEWVILYKDSKKALLVSKYAINAMPLSKKQVTINYFKSKARKWLVSDFYKVAFNDAEKDRILETKIKADSNPEYIVDQGYDLEDKVFLLSVKEVDTYLKNSKYIRCAPTEYALAKGAFASKDDNHTFYWLRTMGEEGKKCAVVDATGKVYYRGNCVDAVGSIRPAIYINIKE